MVFLRWIDHIGISGRVDTGGTVQGFHFQTRIVGKTVYVVVIVDVACLLHGILLQRLSSLGDVYIAAYVLQRQHLNVLTQNLAYLLQFVLIVCCEYYLHCS